MALQESPTEARCPGARRIRLLVEYDGTGFYGFQRQRDRRTVQGVLESALSHCFGHAVEIKGAGRTDTGVHALGQVVHFDTIGRMPVERVPKAVGSRTGPEVVVRVAEETRPEFHARYSATARTYHYYLSPERLTPFQARYAVHSGRLLADGPERMRAALHAVRGRHDFIAFRTPGGSERTTVRTVTRAELVQLSPAGGFQSGFLRVELTADAFLRTMVRNLAGLLLRIGRGEREPEALAWALATGDLGEQRSPAPPQGLFLVRVDYPDGFPADPRPESGTLAERASGQAGEGMEVHGLPPVFAGETRTSGEESRQ